MQAGNGSSLPVRHPNAVVVKVWRIFRTSGSLKDVGIEEAILNAQLCLAEK